MEHGSIGRVVVTDISMPFTSMVMFILKLTLAAIPAMLILSIIGAAMGLVLVFLFPGLFS